MSEPQNKPNVINFIEVVKKKYYSPDYRELSEKKQLHLVDAILNDDKIKKKEEPVGPDGF